ncbi:caspase family protein [Actinoplanes aureus]|uniref:Caspase family protein n=1 Tax=Actinoplanes aureus TaxID=2792083 RepID=A0A931G4N7_9ACTN|nr:caspase family protein [Actinoplanes aureus]MBG0565469.1 caspase family protein [Actinoplanes aureus]
MTINSNSRRRDAGDDDLGLPLVAPVGDRWAVVVGISSYQAGQLNLEWARRDADELCKLLYTPEGGNFHPDRVRLLLDEQATTGALTRALRGFLMAALPADLVLLYFACHGGPDPRRPAGPLYLYTHDTDPADVAGTGLPMDDIDRSLRTVVRADRVVICVDTCHSGGVGTGLRATGRAEATNRYLEALANAKGGVALLTSAEASEAAEEDARWGGGHGVFTHFLLDGMRGAADGYKGTRDGIVSVGELFEYVRDQVQQATDNRQHPNIGDTAFDRSLPMAVTAELDVEQHLTLARGLYQVGWQLDDPAPFLLAARQYALAADLKRHLPPADAGRGAALLAAGHTAEAAQVLRAVTAAAPDEVSAETWLDLGIAQAENGHLPEAVQAFREYARRAPQAAETPWAVAYADWLDGRNPPGRRRALLFGVGTMASQIGMSLPGVVVDVAAMSTTAVAKLGVAPADLTVLVDDKASRDAVLTALAGLRDGSRPDDVVIVYFTGHAADGGGLDDPYLVTDIAGDRPIGITARELIDALDLPVREVVLILDTHVSAALVQYARRAPGPLTVMMACGVGDLAYAARIRGSMHGLFSHALVETLDREEAHTYGDLIDDAGAEMDRLQIAQQTPQLIGSRRARAFDGTFPGAGLWRVWRRRGRTEDVERLRRRCALVDAPLAVWALGVALLRGGDAEAAHRELSRAREALGDPYPQLWADLAEAELNRGRTAAAAEALRAAAAALRADAAPARAGTAESLATALAALTSTVAPAPRLLAIGMEPHAREAAALIAADVAAVAGIAAADVTTLSAAATGPEFLSALRDVAAGSQERQTVLVVAGTVQWRESGAVLLTPDGEVAATEVDQALTGAQNLITLLDLRAAFARSATGTDVALPVEIGKRALALPGSVTVTVFEDELARPVQESAELTGAAMRTLLAALPGAMRDRLSYEQWIAATPLPAPAAVIVRGDRAARQAWEDRSVTIGACRALADFRTAAASETVRCARTLIAGREAQHEPYPEGYLQLGLALQVRNDPAAALAALRKAWSLYDDAGVRRAEQERDPGSAEWQRQARYHFGRLQMLHGEDLNEAVAALRAAHRQDGTDPRVLRALAQAIRALVERESLVHAARYLMDYVNRGAPLGMDADMVDFLNQRRRS